MVHDMEVNWREFWKGVLAQLPVQLGRHSIWFSLWSSWYR